MEPLDLRSQPPCGPRERLAGLVLLPRTIDKARALLPGGEPGTYFIAPGVSAFLLGKLGIDEAAFVASSTGSTANGSRTSSSSTSSPPTMP